MISTPDLYYEKKTMVSLYTHCRLRRSRAWCIGWTCLRWGNHLAQRKPASIKRFISSSRFKTINPQKRQQLIPLIKKIALTWGIGFSTAEEIDQLGIVPATRLAASRAVEALHFIPNFLLTDFRLELPELDTPQTAIVKGDQKSLSIASASILAKTARDEIMSNLDEQFQKYNFATHKGYGTFAHRQKIQQFGYSSIHRKTFQLKEN
ncbi:MAG: ribonuclease HII [Chloroflexi bacterium OLB14]|nr:MAG: ribonuclease HII [Chloroflexi bacterium OLB14]